ncbi:peptidoglycan-binding protein [bacterium]|nr:peptidoglycan-binding protein [bacterium]
MRRQASIVVALVAAALVPFALGSKEAEASTHPTLRFGSRGSAVVTLQHDLAKKGFSPGAADGIFGSHTLAAVKAFQAAHHLAVDGIVGPITWSALESSGGGGGGGGGSHPGSGPLPHWLEPIMEKACMAAHVPVSWAKSHGLYEILAHESSFMPTAKNPTSTAYGLFQFLDSTWATVGGHKTSDAYLQCVYGLKYIHSRYGDPTKAWAFWEAHHWY